jgi:hypothetical protein
LRFRLREALRPLELALLSLGAWVSESLSTRLDSVRVPERLCVDEERLEPDEERLDPDDRPRELALERLFDEDERLFDFDEEFDLDEERLEPPERLLLPDRELLWGILPWLLLGRSLRVRRLPEYRCSTRKNATVQPRTRTAVQIPSSAGKSRWTAGAKGAAGTESQERRDNNGADNAILERHLIARQLEDEEIDE